MSAQTKFEFGRRPCHVICEGSTDHAMLLAVLKAHGLRQYVDVRYPKKRDNGAPGGGGTGGFPLELNTYAGQIESLSKTQAKGLVVMADNDDDPDGRYESVCRNLSDAKLPCPKKRGAVQSGDIGATNITVAILMMPNASDQGCLETVLLRGLKHAAPDTCFDAFRSCLYPTADNWPPHKLDEARLLAMLACSSKKNSGKSLWERINLDHEQCPFDFTAPAFDHVGEFFRGFLGKIGVLPA